MIEGALLAALALILLSAPAIGLVIIEIIERVWKINR